LLDRQLQNVHSRLAALMQTDLPKFNSVLSARGLKIIDAKLPTVVF
jgi:hypothetical protein